MSEKMTKEERELAIKAFRDLSKAAELLKSAYGRCEELLWSYEWDIGVWEISEAARLTGSVALGIAESFGFEDGWYRVCEEAQNETQDA